MKRLTTDLAQSTGILPVKIDEMLKLLDLFGILRYNAIDFYERASLIEELRCKGMPATAIAERLQLDRTSIFRDIKKHKKRRKIVITISHEL